MLIILVINIIRLLLDLCVFTIYLAKESWLSVLYGNISMGTSLLQGRQFTLLVMIPWEINFMQNMLHYYSKLESLPDKHFFFSGSFCGRFQKGSNTINPINLTFWSCKLLPCHLALALILACFLFSESVQCPACMLLSLPLLRTELTSSGSDI